MRSRTNSALSLSVAFGVASVAALASRPAAAQQTTPAPATTPAASATPAVTITGYVEGNYTLNLNEPFGKNQDSGKAGINGNPTNGALYVYNYQDGQFALNLADVRISRAATDASRVGFFIRTIAGAASQETFGDYGPRVLEAYGTMLVPFGGKDIKVDAGQFVTHVGYETIEVGSDNFFSKSFLFSIPEPVYHAGVRASVPLSPATTLGVYLYNRYNGNYDTGNRDIAPGLSLAFNPNSAVSVTLNGLTSRESLAGTGDPGADQDYKQQSILNLIASDQLSKSFKGVLEGVYRFGDYSTTMVVSNGEDGSTTTHPKAHYSSYGVALYGILTMANTDNIGLRLEEFSVNKPDTFLLSYPSDPTKKPNIGSATLSYEPVHWSKKFPNLRTFLEVREDFAGKKLFPDKNGKFKSDETTLTVGQVYSF